MTTPVTPWTDELCARLVAHLQDGLRPFEIARALDMTTGQINAKIYRLRRRDGVPTAPTTRRLDDESLARLRRVARWDAAARHGLEAYERQVSA